MKKSVLLKYGKLLVGTVAAIAAANLLSLKFAYAAGIITLLTIQDTQRETIRITTKRIIIFAFMTVLSAAVFSVLGYGLPAFTVILVPYLFVCLKLNMKEAIAPIAVLCTHYISEKSCSLEMVVNESLLLFVGAAIGILLNLFFTDNNLLMKQKQAQIEKKMREIFAQMARMIQAGETGEPSEQFFSDIDQMLEELKQESLLYINNHFLSGDDYFYHYVTMRIAQCKLLKQIYGDIKRLDMVPEQANEVAAYFGEISEVFRESNDADQLLRDLDALYAHFKKDELPVTRQEFENRALLYHILEDIRRLIVMKQQFYKKFLQ